MGWDFIPILLLSLDALVNPLYFLRLHYHDCGEIDRFLVPCMPGASLAAVDGKMHRSVSEFISTHHSSYRWKIGFESDAGISRFENDGKRRFIHVWKIF